MRELYHLWLHPFSRKIRIALVEKGLPFELKLEKIWERRTAFLKLSPSGDVPVFVDLDGTTLATSYVISEYLDEVYPQVNLMGKSVIDKAETRRMIAWFDFKFNHEVTQNLLGEKMMKRFTNNAEPNGAAIRAGLANIHYHLDYIGFLAERRQWLAGDGFSFADITAAAHLSCIDYIGDVPWDAHPAAKAWYARVKSRPSFRPLLAEAVPGFQPAQHYANADF